MLNIRVELSLKYFSWHHWCCHWCWGHSTHYWSQVDDSFHGMQMIFVDFDNQAMKLTNIFNLIFPFERRECFFMKRFVAKLLRIRYLSVLIISIYATPNTYKLLMFSLFKNEDLMLVKLTTKNRMTINLHNTSWVDFVYPEKRKLIACYNTTQ